MITEDQDIFLSITLAQVSFLIANYFPSKNKMVLISFLNYSQ